MDTSKVCVWGWSFGGYLTGLLLAEVARGLENKKYNKKPLRVPVEIYILVSMMANIKVMNVSNKNMRLVNAESSDDYICLLRHFYSINATHPKNHHISERHACPCSNLLFQDGRQFEMNGERNLHCGIAVAPVTQWHFYGEICLKYKILEV